MQTVSVPILGAVNPSRLVQAPNNSPFRVLVRNVGGVLIYLAFENEDLSSISAVGGVYQLPPGQSDAFVLAPSQSIFAAANGGNGLASVAVSEAIPLKDWMES
jgi:hypothetical protein